MALNLIKLCVGCDSVEDLEEWIAFRLDQRRRAGEPVEHFHTTRMVPTRAAELVDGGSLYWVIKGSVQCRQRLLEVRPFVDSEGISRCHLMLEPVVSDRVAAAPCLPGLALPEAGRSAGSISARAARASLAMPPKLRQRTGRTRPALERRARPATVAGLASRPAPSHLLTYERQEDAGSGQERRSQAPEKRSGIRRNRRLRAPGEGGRAVARGGRRPADPGARRHDEPAADLGLACALQAEMFDAVGKAGSLGVQLVYFRGLGECQASKFVSDTAALKRLMSGIDCRGGNTQIGKVLGHALKETARRQGQCAGLYRRRDGGAA